MIEKFFFGVFPCVVSEKPYRILRVRDIKNINFSRRLPRSLASNSVARRRMNSCCDQTGFQTPSHLHYCFTSFHLWDFLQFVDWRLWMGKYSVAGKRNQFFLLRHSGRSIFSGPVSLRHLFHGWGSSFVPRRRGWVHLARAYGLPKANSFMWHPLIGPPFFHFFRYSLTESCFPDPTSSKYKKDKSFLQYPALNEK